jgi:homocysteine S-methyltransferase
MISEIHRAYLDAGAQLLYTNTFSANPNKLGEQGLVNKLREINEAGVKLAREAALSFSRQVWIAGDIGPLGVRLVPYGRVKSEEARQAFITQIDALCTAGVDLLVLETFGSLSELREAINAARAFCDLPIIASVSFTRDDRTVLGEPPSRVAQILSEAGADVIGANCSGGPAQLFRIIKQMKQVFPGIPTLVKPNAGWPEQVGGRVMYSASAAYFGEYVRKYTNLGVNILGGCCGTTPAHIAEMRNGLDALSEIREISYEETGQPSEDIREMVPEQPTQLAQKLSAGEFVFSVEMDPPRGLAPHKIIAGASTLVEAGADVINVADSPMARMRMSPWAVCALIQQDVGIETTLHFPTRGRNLLRVQGDLLAAHALGIRNVFVVLGDPTAIGDYPEAMDDYDLVPSGLMKLIKQKFNQGIDHSGTDIGQPTSFFVGCALNLLSPDPEREMKVLQRKVKNGADFALTQPVYQPERAQEFMDRYTDTYGPLEIPILVGILPLFSSRHAAFLHHEVPGITITEHIRQRVEKAGDGAPQEGVQISCELIEAIKLWGQGIYLMPAFGRYDLVAEILETASQ